MTRVSLRPYPTGWQPQDRPGVRRVGLAAWHEARRCEAPPPAFHAMTREQRLDLSRTQEVRDRAHAAVLDRSSDPAPEATGQPGAVVAHRHRWVRDALVERLGEAGVHVLEAVEDGAHAVGAVVVGQPDLLLVEDRLPSMAGRAVVLAARRYAPHAVLAVQVADSSLLQDVYAARPALVFSRRVPPAEVVAQLVAALGQPEGDTVTVL